MENESERHVLLTEAAVAKKLGVNRSTVKRWRQESAGPPCVQLGPRGMRYRWSDVEAWLDQKQTGGVPTPTPAAPVAPTISSPVLTEQETAALLRISVPSLRTYRRRGQGPPALHIGGATYRYLAASVYKYLGLAGERQDKQVYVSGQAPSEESSDHRVGYGAHATVRPDQSHPGAWSPNRDGSWRSPGGRTYQPTSKMIAALIERRRALGLSTTFEEETRGNSAAIHQT